MQRQDSLFLVFFLSLTIIGCVAQQQLPPSKPMQSMILPKVASNKSKTEFIAIMRQHAQALNQQIMLKRQRVLKLQQQRTTLSSTAQAWLIALAKQYGLSNFDINNNNSWQTLLSRVDIIPEGLVIAQAINESAWGRSRFAVEANNYFGQWCYRPGCGLVPKRRPANKTYEVRKFANLQASMRAYFQNLNTTVFYQKLRQLRAKRRQRQQTITAKSLLPGLENYSQTRHVYVNSLRAIIAHYHLDSER